MKKKTNVDIDEKVGKLCDKLVAAINLETEKLESRERLCATLCTLLLGTTKDPVEGLGMLEVTKYAMKDVVERLK